MAGSPGAAGEEAALEDEAEGEPHVVRVADAADGDGGEREEGVRITPGAMAATRMPYFASSRAHVRVAESSPALEAP